jgi:hypothetical protein
MTDPLPQTLTVVFNEALCASRRLGQQRAENGSTSLLDHFVGTSEQ